MRSAGFGPRYNLNGEAIMREVINTTAAAAAIGPYSQAIRAGDFVFTSGQIGLEPESGKMAEGVEAQTKQVLANLKAVLDAAGASFEQIVKTTIFLVDMADFQTVNTLYATEFAAEPPARSTMQVAALPRKALVEIEAVAHAPKR
jgi:2-iminobutanoate/2-iminopropanoate deaminase